MAAGSFTVLNTAKLKIVNGTIALGSHAFKAALFTSSLSISATFTGTSTNAQYGDLSNEVANGNGYLTGGATLSSVSLTGSTGTVTFTSAAPSWSSATFTAKYLVIYDNTNANKDIVGFMDLDTGAPSGDSATAGTFTVNPNASGWFTIS